MSKRLFGLIVVCIALFLFCAPNDSQTHEYDWASLDEESFESFQPTDKIMDTIGVTEGMKVGEVGAGGGRVAARVAKIVGPKGKVYANDITDSALEYMRQRCIREQINNMEVIEGTLTDPNFADNALDVVYLTNTYRHLDKPLEVLRSIRLSLKQSGKLGIIDSKRYQRAAEDEAGEGINTIIQTATQAGYRLIELESFLPRDDIYIFQKLHKP